MGPQGRFRMQCKGSHKGDTKGLQRGIQRGGRRRGQKSQKISFSRNSGMPCRALGGHHGGSKDGLKRSRDPLLSHWPNGPLQAPAPPGAQTKFGTWTEARLRRATWVRPSSLLEPVPCATGSRRCRSASAEPLGHFSCGGFVRGRPPR